MAPVRACEVCRSTDRHFPGLKLPIRRPDAGKLGKDAFTRIPHHIRKAILTKMDQKSFTRMRRVNSNLNAFVEQNRKVLNFAMFKGWHISFENALNRNVMVVFHSPPMPAEEIEHHEMDMDTTVMSPDELVTKHIHKGEHKHLAFSFTLSDFYKFDYLRKEFVGVTGIISVKNNMSHIDGEMATRIGKFLKDLGLIKIQKFDTSIISPASLNIFFDYIKPDQLHIAGLHDEVPDDMFNSAMFSGLCEFSLNELPDCFDIRYFAPKLDEFEVDGASQKTLNNGLTLIQMFRDGLCDMNYMKINATGFISLRRQYNITRVYNRREARELVLKAYSDAKMEFTYTDWMLVFEVPCTTSNEKGVCIINIYDPVDYPHKAGQLDLYFKRIPHNE